MNLPAYHQFWFKSVEIRYFLVLLSRKECCLKDWDYKDKRWQKRIANQEKIAKFVVVGGMIALIEVLGLAFLELYLQIPLNK